MGDHGPVFVNHEDVPLAVHALLGVVVLDGFCEAHRIVKVNGLLNESLGIDRRVGLARALFVPADPKVMPS